MKKIITFWPKPSFKNCLTSLNLLCSESKIEKLLFNMFPSGHPVLVSSGRSAIYLALLATGANRSKKVETFEYASHCVLDAITRIATPFGFSEKNAEYKIHYHQWGHESKIDTNSILIEDSVDSLYVPGSPLFNSDGDFEVWSLTKSVGTFTGGVLWCKSKKNAIKCRKIRDSQNRSNFQLFLKFISNNFNFGTNFWLSNEATSIKLSLLSLGEIKSKVKKWSEEVECRVHALKILNLYPKSKLNRLPAAIPLDYNKIPEIIKNNFEFKSRHFKRKIVFPLPIHNQVPRKLLLDIKAILN